MSDLFDRLERERQSSQPARQLDLFDRVGPEPMRRAAAGMREDAAGIRARAASDSRIATARREADAAVADAAQNDGTLDRLGDLWDRGVAGVVGGIGRAQSVLNVRPSVRQEAAAYSREQERIANSPVAGEVTFDDVLAKPSIGGIGQFVLDQGVASLPGMAMAALPGGVGLGTFAVSQAGSIGQQRAEANGRTDATLGDVALAAPAAIGSALLERAGIESILGATGKNVATRIGKAAAGESLTEAVQSPIEYAGGSLGTDEGFSIKEAGKQAVAGALVGGAVGGSLRSVGEAGGATLRVARGRTAGRDITPGIVDQAVAEAAVTPDDVASPLPKDAIAVGRATTAEASGTGGADAILREAGLPAVGSRVSVKVGDETRGGTIRDAFTTDAGAAGTSNGLRIALDDGDELTEHFDTLADAGVQITPEGPSTAAADAIDAQLQAAAAATAPTPTPAAAAAPATAAAPTGDVEQTIAAVIPRIGRAESPSDTAKNPRSSAEGRYQFTDGTWLATYRRTFGKTGESDAQILAKKTDGAVQDRVMQTLTRENAAALQKAGLPVTPGTLYLAHFAGSGGATKLLKADPNTPVEQIVGAAAVKANPEVLGGKTVGQVVAWAAGRVGAADQGGTTQPPAQTQWTDLPREDAADARAATDGTNVALPAAPEQVTARAAEEKPATSPAQPVAAPVLPVSTAEPVKAKTGLVSQKDGWPVAEFVRDLARDDGRYAVRGHAILETQSGRQTAPAPKFNDTTRATRARSLAEQEKWLRDEAIKEAEVAPRGTLAANALPFLRSMRPGNMSMADHGTVNDVLFGDANGPAGRASWKTDSAPPKKSAPARAPAPPPATSLPSPWQETGSGEAPVSVAAPPQQSVDSVTLDRARELVMESGNGSASHLGRKLEIRQTEAMRVMAALEREGVVSPVNNRGGRDVLRRAEKQPPQRYEYASHMEGAEAQANRAVVDALNGEATQAEAVERVARLVRDGSIPEGVARIQLGRLDSVTEGDLSAALAPRPEPAGLVTPSAGATSAGEAAPPPAPATSSSEPSRFAGNKVFTEDRLTAARARLKDKLNRVNSGIDPELLYDGVVIAGAYIEAGVRRFADVAKALADDLGTDLATLKPYLRAWYNGARDMLEDSGEDVSDMDGPGAVRAALTMIEAEATPRAEPATEPVDAELAEPVGAGKADRDRDARAGAGDAFAAEGERPATVGAERPGSDGAGSARGDDAGGDRADRGAEEPSAGERATGADDAGAERVRGSSDRDGDRVQPKRRRASGPANYLAPAGSLKREGSWLRTAARNLDIIELVNKLDAEGRPATADEQALLAKFTGWGASEIANNLFKGVDREAGEPRIKVDSWERGEWADLRRRAADLLKGENLKTALRTTQYAHYTSEDVIRSIWSAVERMGFAGGRVMEPGMGIGLFMAAAPEAVAKASSYTGIELDGFTAKVAAYLLPQANVRAGDFTREKLPDGFFDVAIGNPPFSSTQVLDDPVYRKHRLALHDYFFAKSIDKVRPGGLMVFVTSRYTMDKLRDRGRGYIAERADLLGAIRLPQTAFKENAGTEVVTDILFFQKRAPGAEPGGEAWLKTEPVTVGGQQVQLNEYFARNPEMILGRNALTRGMYRADEYTVEPPVEPIAEALARAAAKLPQDVYTAAPTRAREEAEAKSWEADMRPAAEKEGGLYVGDDGQVFVREQGVGKPVTAIDGKLKAADLAWLRSYAGLRDALKAAQRDQLRGGDWEKSLAALNRSYDAFVKAHGPVLDSVTTERRSTDDDGNETVTVYRRYKNQRLLDLDVESPLLFGLEKVADDGTVTKGAALKGRVLNAPLKRTVESAADALAVTLDDIGRLDLDYAAKLLGQSREAVVEALGDGIFQTPSGEWQTADEYLSGDVVTRLEEARAAADTDPAFNRNVDALIAVQPKPLGPADVTVKLGAGWVPLDVVKAFAGEIVGIDAASLVYEPATAEWAMDKIGSRTARRAGTEYGTEDRSPQEIMLAVLNNQTIKVTRTDSDKKVYTDQEATALANERAKNLAARFSTWIWEDAGRASELLELYNRRFNNIAPRRFDGGHLTLPGLSARFQLYPHQKRVIWRMIQTGNTYLAHAVGAGKTLEMIVGAMEQRRLGLVKKPMFVVPNHMLNQFAREFMEAYPAANIMVADEKSFHTDNRRRFMAQAAFNNPDAIIVTHSSLAKIDTSDEARAAVVARMVEELTQAKAGADNRHTVKKIEKQIEAIEKRFSGKLGQSSDRALTFEEMGVDMLIADEAHEFRKLDYSTNRAIKGIDPVGSQRALDLYVKTRWLETQNPGRSLVMASGTPVTNTMAEIYTVMRFMDEATLEADGLRAFDAWANMFGEVAAGYEQNAAGGYEIVERFAKFVNVPELMKRVRSFMDVLTSDQLGDLVKRPTVNGGVPENVVTPPIDALKDYMQGELKERIEKSRRWKPSREEPNNPDPIIAINGDARLSSIDMRFIDASLPDDPGSKLNQMIDRIIATNERIKGIAYTNPATGKVEPVKGGTQIVFSSVGFGEGAQKNRGFDLRGHLERRLLAGGFKKGEIAWMSDASTHAKKEALFKEMRAGRVRVLIGSPKNMGTGVNVQNRLKALHYLSPPWYPSDVEQPHGRIIRQGNWNEDVDLFWYATKGTYDSTAWGMVTRKARFIEQALTGDDSVRKLEDVSEANQYEMASAMAAGDERVIQVAGLSSDITRLERLADAHAQEQRSLASDRNTYERYALPRAQEMVAALKSAVPLRQPLAPFSVEVNGQIFTKQGEAGRALKEAMVTINDGVVGRYQGHPIELVTSGSSAKLVVHIGDHYADTGLYRSEALEADQVGLATRIANAVARIPSDLASAEQRVQEAETQLRAIGRKLGAPFPQAQELVEKVADRARLQQEMAAETKAEQDAADKRAAEAKGDTPKESRVEDEAPVAVLTGDEFGKLLPPGRSRIILLRDRAISWFTNHLLNRTLTASDGKPVTFNMRGASKSTSRKGDLVLRMVPAIPALIVKGKRSEVPARADRGGYAEMFSGIVELDGQRHLVGAIVITDANGRRHYDLTNAVRDIGDPAEPRRSADDPGSAQSRTSVPEMDVASDADINLVLLSPSDNGGPDGSPEPDWDAAVADLTERLTGLGLADRVRASVVAKLDPRGRVAGDYLPGGLIRVALAAPQDATVTLDHEAIHALRDLGLFLPPEWRTLETAARADEAVMASVRRRYPDLGEDAQVEEAVADRFARWRRGDGSERGFAARVFERVRGFLDALGNALRGNGFRTADDVMAAIGRGDVGARPTGSGEPAPGIGPRQSIAATHSFDSDETERRFRAATEGLGDGDGWIARAKVELAGIRDKMTRHWVALPNEPRYAALQQKLRALESAPQAAKERAVRLLSEMVEGFSRADLDLLARKVILDDLMWEAAQDHDLPFGLTPETLKAERAKIDAILKADPDRKVWKAAMKRKVVNRAVALELVDAGVLTSDRIKNPAYFRHQVLDYARTQARIAASGQKRLRSPKWAKRMGSSLDINANLLEAEFDWLSKALTDIPVARAIEWIKTSEHNILGRLRREAREQNRAGVAAKIADAQAVLDDANATAKETAAAQTLIDTEKGFRQNIAFGFSTVKQAFDRGAFTPPRELAGAAAALGSRSESPQTFALLSWMLDNDVEGAIGAAMVLKAISQRRAWQKALLGDAFIDTTNADELVKKLAPDGYTTWQPDEGKLLFTVKTIPEHVIDGMVEKITTVAGLDAADLLPALEKARSALSMGGDKYAMILPQEVADTLNALRREDVEGLLGEALAVPMRYWKRWVLINPRRIIKYNLNNLTGDLDVVLAGNPRLLRHTARAGRELASVMRGKAKPSARYEEAVARGVFDSGLSVQEIPDINRLSAFEQLAEGRSNRPDKLVTAALSKAWQGLQGFTQWRENVFRYAAYLDYVERLEAGETAQAIGYGASHPAMVEAVTDTKDKAALLARDLIGDYGAISEGGKWLRSHAIPFWSWLEINTKRYWRLTANAYEQGVGRGIATGGGLAIAAGARTSAWLALRMMALYGAISLWNWLFFDDEEQELSEQQRRQLHVILGRDDDGRVVTLRTQGALSDAVSWLGFAETAAAWHAYENGRGTLGSVLAAPFKVPVNKVATGLSPAISIPIESATGKELWPDVFETRVNRDPWRNLFSTLSLENEYDSARALPSRGYGQSWIDGVVYRREPGEIAYDEARGIAYDWLRQVKGQEGSSDFSTPRSEQTRRFKQARRFGDEEAEAAALDRMGELGMTDKDLLGSIKRAAPLGPIPKKDRAAFLESLTDEEYATFQQAQGWYEETFAPR